MSDNREQLEYWNGAGGERWSTDQERLDAAIRPFGEALLTRVGVSSSARVLDVGSGCGDLCLSLCERVGAKGSVVGVDISRPMLAVARERLRANPQVALLEADAGTHHFARQFDCVVSRFGVMFFSAPVAAFRNLRSALKPTGKLAFVCWQSLRDNPWCYDVLQALRNVWADAPPVVGVQQTERAPGPFAFADPEYVQELLEGAGFTDIEIESFEADVVLSTRGVQAAVDFATRTGPAARLLNEAPDSVRKRGIEAIHQLLTERAEGDRVALRGASWIVCARSLSNADR